MNTETINWPARTGAAIQTTPEDERVASEVKQALMRSKWEAEEQMTPMPFWDWVYICVVMAACMFVWVMLGPWLVLPLLVPLMIGIVMLIKWAMS